MRSRWARWQECNAGKSWQGPYPTIVKKSNGREAAVVQAFAYTKYLGKIRLTFDDDGHLTNWVGDPVLLDKHILEDSKVGAA